MWQLAERELGGLDAIEFGREVVDRLHCTSCGGQQRVLVAAEGVSGDLVKCPHCGSERAATFIYAVHRGNGLLQIPLRDAGLPPWDILWARRGEEFLGVEIAGDRCHAERTEL